MSAWKGKAGWGDDEEDENFLPSPHETKVDGNGVKTVTEYKFNEVQQKVKVTKKVKVLKVVKRQNVQVQGRKDRIQKFGDAKDCEDESNVTIIDYNQVRMLDPKASEAEDGASQANVASSFAKFQEKQKWRALQRKYDMEGGENPDMPPGADDDEGDDKPAGGGLFGKIGTKYVPPGARGELAGPGAAKGGGVSGATFSGGGGGLSGMAADDRDYTSLRVMNISEDTKEADLQELFERFGRIFRIYLAKDRETGESRGFAFVSFSRREDAERAMEALQGYGYDHLILKIEWAKPSTKPDGDPGSAGTQFRSGYGKALAQDTTEKVSFASNLTK
mmetsp:Transcript_7483/g.15679  ORF Transcript_7483/g.15679 Transcript_7483/m.15679 type:complete len:333 (-) Transcript_7483:510-1508(-)|eukprot:CAMPEP_0119468492 /NCGR_PEP_ID=MMETSP1344-20130328/2224_1 /TAXON_ID=236787 /ORGANISM="Florenciella parvula, Strain CCMP2471" /LENGTH=332 /DNA_ID=CAMNT_0007500967 /DNA_START=74 /DNA_END=1072 /DNA_ORIENTATION=-